MLGADKVFFNTFINSHDLVPQRGLNYLPACMADFPDSVEWGNVCAITGGDLTDPNTLQALLDRTPTGISITTCNAETVHTFTPFVARRFLVPGCLSHINPT
jgi:hypothetical protein